MTRGRALEALLRRGSSRVRANLGTVALAAVAATLAWFVAHRLLGHAQPFFAPIAAAISISTSRIQRSRRIVQMVGGVLLGIGVGELMLAIFGFGLIALLAIVFVTLCAALLSGEGVFGEGMMFANQAAASAILVVTLHRTGTGSERAVDALVGGACALVLGVVLFPAHPLALLEEAEKAVLRVLADALDAVAVMLRTSSPRSEDWILEQGREIHVRLATLSRVRSTARANVRIAPRRWGLRAAVAAEDRRTAQLDLLGGAVLDAARIAFAQLTDGRAAPARLGDELAEIGSAIDRLARAPQPWAPELRAAVGDTVQHASAYAITTPVEAMPALATAIRAIAIDLGRVIDLPPERQVRPPRYRHAARL